MVPDEFSMQEDEVNEDLDKDESSEELEGDESQSETIYKCEKESCREFGKPFNFASEKAKHDRYVNIPVADRVYIKYNSGYYAHSLHLHQ